MKSALRRTWRKIYGAWLTAHALLLDRPLLAWPVLFPRLGRRLVGSWLDFRNRGERLRPAQDGRGYEPLWSGPTPLRISQRLPSISRRILEAALHEWPIRFASSWQRDGSRSPEVSFIIGHRGRARLPQLRATLETVFAQTDCACECLVVEQDHRPAIDPQSLGGVRYVFDRCPGEMPYNRGRAFNVGAAQARGRIVVLHDNDLLVPHRYAAELVRLAYAGYHAVKIYRYIFYLDRPTTGRLLAARDLGKPGLDRIAHNNVGGSVALRTDAYFAIGGYDEAFVGWGFEDEEMFDRCRTVSCYAYGFLPLVHLDHDTQPADSQAPNLALLQQRRTIPAQERTLRLSK